MSERSGQTAKGKDGKAKYASLNLFDTYKGKSLEAHKPVVAPRHGLQSLGKVASARRMPPPANLPSLKAENKGNDPNVSLVPKDGTGWASKQEPVDPKSTDVLSAQPPELQQPVVTPTPASIQQSTPPPLEAPASALAAGAKSWAQASVTHGVPGDGGKGSNQLSPFSREEFPSLQAAGDQDRAGKEQVTTDQWYGPGPSLRPQNVTSWRDGGGCTMTAVLSREGVGEVGVGGAALVEGASEGVQPLYQQQQTPPSHIPPRNSPASSPALPPPPIAPQFPAYRGIMPPFMYPPYLPFPPPYGPQGPYRYPMPEAPRFSRLQGGHTAQEGGLRVRGGEVVQRPSILKQDDLKELDELDHDGDEGWAGAQEETDYSAKLQFSDDEGEEELDEERRESGDKQQPAEGPAPVTHSCGPDSGGNASRTPPSLEDTPPPFPSKPGWAEEGTGDWGAPGNSGPYQGQRPGLTRPREQPPPPAGPLLSQAPYFYRQDRPSSQLGTLTIAPTSTIPVQRLSPSASLSQQKQPSTTPTPPPLSSTSLLPQPQVEDEEETWRQRRKQSSTEISAAVERARRRREEEERRMEEERRAACAEKLKRLDEKQQQNKPAPVGNGNPSPSLCASAPSPTLSQPSSPCVDSEEPPLLSAQTGARPGAGGGSNDRQRERSNSSYDPNTESQHCPPPPEVQPMPQDVAVVEEEKEEFKAAPSVRNAGGADMVKMESLGGGGGRQGGSLLGQGYSKYQKSLPPRFQRQQQEQLLKQQQQWQQQHIQVSQNQVTPQVPSSQGPSPGFSTQSVSKQPPLYPHGSLGCPPPLPMNFDPRWMMMTPYMDPRMMQGRPPPMDYYPPSMHPSGLVGRERSDSGGSGSDPFDRQQHLGPSHPHRGTPPMDPKLAWAPDAFPGGSEGRIEEEGSGKGLRSSTSPVHLRDGGACSNQQLLTSFVAPNSSPSSSSNQMPASLVSQGGGVSGVGNQLPHHHQSLMGGRGNYSSFSDNGSRVALRQQQRVNSGGSQHGFNQQDEGPRGGTLWGTPRPNYDRNGRPELSPVDNMPNLHQHHPHPHPHRHQPSHFPLQLHKTETGRERDRVGETKKDDPKKSVHQPCLSSSCSSSSCSSSSARDDNSGKSSLHHLPPQHDAGVGLGGGGKVNKMGSLNILSSHSSFMAPSQHPPQLLQQQHHPKQSHRGRDHKTETQWGPRPASSNISGAHGHNKKSSAGVSSKAEEGLTSLITEQKPSILSRGGNSNKRVGPIKRTMLKENKREGGEGEGGEKPTGGIGKDKEPESKPVSAKHDTQSNHISTIPSSKDDTLQSNKPRIGGKERAGGLGKGPKDGDAPTLPSGFSAPVPQWERERSRERGGGGPYLNPAPARSSRGSRGRGGEFYGRGRGYRGTYTGSGSGGGSSSNRGRAGGRSSRDYRPTNNSYHHARNHGSSTKDSSIYKGEAVVGSGRPVQGGSQLNPGRSRNRSETRSEGSEYEEVSKRRRQRGSESGSESAASDLGHSDKEDRKRQSKNMSSNKPTTATTTTSAGATQSRNPQARIFTPRGVPSRRGRGGGGGGGGGSGSGSIYRNGGSGGMSSSRSGSSSTPHSWASKSSSSVHRQKMISQSSLSQDAGHGVVGENKDKAVDKDSDSIPTVLSSALQQITLENGNVETEHSSANPPANSPSLPLPLPAPDLYGFPPHGFERPPRRRRNCRSQHQHDKPPRFRRLKQERENAARIIGGGGTIGGGGQQQQQLTTPSQNSLKEANSSPNAAITATTPNVNQSLVGSSTENDSRNHLDGTKPSSNSHNHHNTLATAPQAISQHHCSHNPGEEFKEVVGTKSPDISNQNSDQANEEWETASESSDFADYRERGGGGKSQYLSRPFHSSGRGSGGGDREMTAKESAANKRSFSSQRPGMERQNRRVNAGSGGGGRGLRGSAGGGGGAPSNGSSNLDDKRGNWPAPKTRK